MFHDRLGRATRDLVNYRNISACFRRVITKVDFLIDTRVQLLIQRRVSFFRLVPLAQVRSLGFRQGRFLDVTQVGIVDVGRDLILVQYNMRRKRIITIVEESRSMLITIRGRFLRAYPINGYVLTMDRFIHVRLFRSRIRTRFTRANCVNARFRTYLLIPTDRIYERHFKERSL